MEDLMAAQASTLDDIRPPRAILLALGLGVLLAALDQSIVSTALPTVAGDLGGLTDLTWVVTAYLVTETVSMPLYGKLGDRFGRKSVLVGAIALFLAGSALSGLAGSMTELVAFRALQGLGAGGLIVTAMAVVGDLVAPQQRARYMGMIGGVFALASIAGPLLGGVAVDALSWRWIFFVNLPVGGAALAVIVASLPSAPATGRRPLDVTGGALLTAAAAGTVLVASWGGNRYEWDSATILALAATAALAALAFVHIERRAADPVLPLELFRGHGFAAAAVSGFMAGFAMVGAVTFLPLHLQVIDGAEATESGLRLMPMVAGALVSAAIASPRLAGSARYRAYPAAGVVLLAGALLWMSTVDERTSDVVTGVIMLAMGLGMGLVMQVVILVAQNHAPRRHMGVATSTATFARSIGGTIGVAVFGAIFAARLSGELAGLGGAGKALTEGGAQLDPERVQALPAGVHAEVTDAFSSALGLTFSAGAAVAAIALLAVLALPRALEPDDGDAQAARTHDKAAPVAA
jgi:EmrB/QacA subfamily drug resistance transporter